VTKRIGPNIVEGGLACGECGKSYAIRKGIPRFVESDAYVRSFSAEWNVFSKTQLDVEGRLGSRDTFTEKTGVKPSDLSGYNILEAGCGMGRFLDVVSEAPRSNVVGFDLSLSVEAAYENLARRSNVCILQADLMKPPFGKESFDFVYSIGVLHHTSDPKRAFMELVPLVKAGGQIAIWVYHTYRWPPLSDFYRIATKRMPWSMVLAISKLLSSSYSISRKLRYLRVLFPISDASDPQLRILDTFDWYSPRYQFKFTITEVISWFKEAGLTDIEVLSVPISIRARRPRR
jgi:SAM-dependent methyltransferase